MNWEDLPTRAVFLGFAGFADEDNRIAWIDFFVCDDSEAT